MIGFKMEDVAKDWCRQWCATHTYICNILYDNIILYLYTFIYFYIHLCFLFICFRVFKLCTLCSNNVHLEPKQVLPYLLVLFLCPLMVPAVSANKGYPKLYLCKYSILAGSSYLCQIQAVALLCGGHVYGRCHPQGSGYDGDPRRRRWWWVHERAANVGMNSGRMFFVIDKWFFLVGGLEHEFYFLHIMALGMSSSQLTFIFFRGVGQPPTRWCTDSQMSGSGDPNSFGSGFMTGMC